MAAGHFSGHFKIVTPQSSATKMTDSQEMGDVGAYNNYTWYQRLIQGSASRMTRYREYDLMDNDIEVSRALDTIAEEMTGNNPKTKEPLKLDILTEDEDNVESTAVLTLKAALRRWGQMHDFPSRLYSTARLMVKYGDVFFRKGKRMGDKWMFIHPKNVIAAVVSEHDVTKVVAWQIKNDIQKPKSGGYSMPLGAKQDTQQESEIIPSNQIIRFSLSDDMSDTQPFGESILRAIYRSHKQKELLEDAVLIYRIQRAPERRVFYIDVGKMHPARVKQYLENIKNEIKQKKIPTLNGGQQQVDSTYNPHSMSEDFYFASRPDGRGSRVETLPGGQGLGELSDLEYFQHKIWRGLKIPISYMQESGDGGSVWNDGKVGIAYIQELRFSLYIERLQAYMERVIDDEFKDFLRSANIRIDEQMYRILLPEPSNFGKYRQLELDSQLLSAYTTADGIPYFSPRFTMSRYLQMTPEEIITNERLKREELGLDPDSQDPADLKLIYGAPEEAGLGGMGGGGMGGGFGGAELGMGAEPAPGGEESGPTAQPNSTPT